MNSQEYIEVAIKIAPFSEENAEIVTAEISELPFESFTMDDPYLKCYIQKERYDAQDLKVVLSGVEGMGFDIDFTADLMPAVNWNAVWESQFTPIVVDGKCTIKASFHEGLKKTRFNITIDPKMAFGTGHHQTTYMMCRALLQNEDAGKGKVVMDMGCGTAVLAILAAKMKAALENKAKKAAKEAEKKRKAEEKAAKEKAAKAAAANAPAQEQPAKKRKLTYKEQKELEQLEKDLESLAEEKAELEDKLNGGTLPYEELQKTSERIGQIMELTDEKEFRLLELYELM